MTCSIDLRRRVLSAVKNGATHQEAAERFNVSTASIARWKKRLEPQKTGPKSAHRIDMTKLQQHIQDHPDAYLAERADALGVSYVGIWHAMKRLGVTKKNMDVQTK